MGTACEEQLFTRRFTSVPLSGQKIDCTWVKNIKQQKLSHITLQWLSTTGVFDMDIVQEAKSIIILLFSILFYVPDIRLLVQ
jgi:hypothetical protein